MKKNILIISIIAGFAAGLFFCDDDNPADNGDGQYSPVVGKWEGIMQAIPLFFNGLLIYVDITGPDSTYELITTRLEPEKDTTFIHSGVWDIMGDTIYLDADYCALRDTANDTLVELPDCGDEIPICIDIENGNQWDISLDELESVANSLNIDISKLPYDVSIVLVKKE